MTVQFSPDDLGPIVAAVVEQTLARIDGLGKDRIGYLESEAAALCGMQKYMLRDARLRGEVKGKRVGKSIYYSRAELIRFLEK